jgi:hypothetical protein
MNRPRHSLLLHDLDDLKIRQLLPALAARVHVQLQRDTLGEAEAPVEEHGERFASVLTVHDEGISSRVLPCMILQGAPRRDKLRRGPHAVHHALPPGSFDPPRTIWHDRRHAASLEWGKAREDQ